MSINFDGRHASIDLETMSLASNAVVLSIGLVVFDFSGQIYSRHVWHPSIGEQLGMGRHISPDTMKWWSTQSDAARMVFDEPGTHVLSVINGCAAVCEGLAGVWGFGASEDNAKVIDLGLAVGADPWHFRKNRCGRTLIALAEGFTWPAKVGTAHNAVDDAESQALGMVRAAGIISGLNP